MPKADKPDQTIVLLMRQTFSGRPGRRGRALAEGHEEGVSLVPLRDGPPAVRRLNPHHTPNSDDRDRGAQPVRAEQDADQARQPGERGAEQRPAPRAGRAPAPSRARTAPTPPGPAIQPQSSKKLCGSATARAIDSTATASRLRQRRPHRPCTIHRGHRRR